MQFFSIHFAVTQNHTHDGFVDLLVEELEISAKKQLEEKSSTTKSKTVSTYLVQKFILQCAEFNLFICNIWYFRLRFMEWLLRCPVK